MPNRIVPEASGIASPPDHPDHTHDLPWLALLEHSRDIVHVLDANAVIRYITPSVERVLGYRPEEMIGRSGAEFVHPDDLEASVDITQRALEEGVGGTIELRLRHKDGSWRVVEAAGSCPAGVSPPVLVINSRDITQRKETEQALAAAEARFRFLVEQSVVGIFIIRGGRFLYVNPKLAEVFGYAADELISRSVYEVVVADDRQLVRRRLRRRPGGGEVPEAFRFRALHRDGSTRVIEVHGGSAVLDGAAVVVGACQDVSVQVRGEEALRKSEERYRRFFEDDLTGDCISAPDGTIIACNRAFAEMFGYESVEEARTANAVEQYPHPDDRQALVERLTRERRIVGEELELRRIDGTPIHVVQNMIGVFDDSGGLLQIRRYLFDVTERRLAEQALHMSEERFRLVSRATNDVIWDLVLPSGRLWFNDIAAQVLRCRPEDLVGLAVEWWYERIHPGDRERVVGGFHEAVNGVDDTWAAEYRFRRGDGSYAVMLDRGFVVRDENGAATRIVGSMLDVTERRRAEEAQRLLVRVGEVMDESLDADSALTAVARLAVPAMGDDCMIDLVDEAGGGIRRVAAIHLDPSRETALAREAIDPPRDEPGDHPVMRVLRTGHSALVPNLDETPPETGEDAVPDRHAAWREAGIRSYMIVPMVARGRALGAITLTSANSDRHLGPMDLLLGENLARRVALAVDNARLFREAQQAVKAREEILAVVSHDLRNPLSTIKVSAQLALETSDQGAANRRALEMIERSVDHMEGLIGDLLDVSRLQGGQLRVGRMPCEVGQILDETREQFELLARRTGVELSFRKTRNLPRVSADPRRIRQILSNLVANAIKFTPPGGAVGVGAKRARGFVEFVVADTGPGIPADQLPHLFEPFWQAPNAVGTGIGLGLSIVKGLVEAHGGRVWVESESGQGATFHFVLPAAATAERAPGARAAPSRPG